MGDPPSSAARDLRGKLSALLMTYVQPQRRVDLPAIGDALGLPTVDDDPALSKANYLRARLDRLDSEDVIREAARRFAERYPLASHPQTFDLEETLWRHQGAARIQKRLRRELAQALAAVPLFLKGDAFLVLLQSLFVLEGPLDAFVRSGRSLKEQIVQHMLRNDDWTADDLLEQLGAYEVSDERFVRLLVGLGSGDVRPDIDEQRRYAAIVNKALESAGSALYERETSDGYLAFTLLPRTAGGQHAPKNLIFASERKPDLRFRDAISNDVELVGDPNQVLIYERPLADGLTWGALQAWWAETHSLAAEAAKKSLYHRLLRALPESSPPQRLLFTTYFATYREAIPSLPALLPEVWLHYDPRTVEARGREALLRQRMDFLMLFSGDVRVVLEVDGSHHYSSPAAYAAMAAADRDLRLLGYEVYHFGAAELAGQSAAEAIRQFFRRLLARYRIRPG